MVYIDDYAHHPAELEALITGAKGFVPGPEVYGNLSAAPLQPDQ